MTALIGDAVARVDGYAKVTGSARYMGEVTLPGTVHAALVLSTVASGRVADIDTAEALRAEGVIEILTHQNAGRLSKSEFLLLLQADTVWHAGQPIAMVLADTVSQARRAAALVRVDYETSVASTSLDGESEDIYAPAIVNRRPTDTLRGDPSTEANDCAATVERSYSTPINNHNPIEPHAAVASWTDNHVVVHTTTQAVFLARSALASAFGLPPDRVRVVSTLLGGGFCSKGRAWWPALCLVVLASRKLGRPVRLELRREEMFTVVGNRQRTQQKIALSASADGRLLAMKHETLAQTSAFGEYADPNSFPSRVLYACPNVATSHRLLRGNVPHPVPMRAPGEGTGTFALESAIDELAFELRIDPLEFRIRNYASFDQDANRPWSSNGLRECYRVGSAAFGWASRPIEPLTLKCARSLIGWGMASAYYPVLQAPANATVSITAAGEALVRCGTQDIGTGTYTVIAQLAADVLGIPIARVRVELGDTALPEGPPSVGSMSAASFTPAVTRAAEALRLKLVMAAVSQSSSPFYGANADSVLVSEGRLASATTGISEDIAEVVVRAGEAFIEASGSAEQTDGSKLYSSNAYGAVFVEVHVSEDTGSVRVSRVAAAYAAGRILNARTARSQYIGGLVFGIGMALHEETRFDRNSGRIVNGNLADYLVPVHADVPDIDVHLVKESDEHLGNGGVKGIGMLGTVGTAAAVANAVFHATGKRIRDLPIRLENVLG